MNWKIVIETDNKGCPYLRIDYNKNGVCAASFFNPPYKQKHIQCTRKNCPYRKKE